MGYRYKRDINGKVTKRKAHCAARGDTMIPNIHYDPERTTTYMTDKSSVRLLFAIAAAHNLLIEHIDIEAANLHEDFDHSGEKPFYVRQHPRFDGTYKHECKGGKLVKNLYGTRKQDSHTYKSFSAS